MSKLNRSEFKELLTEWKQNFINERGPLRKDYKKEIPASLCPVSKDEMNELSNKVADMLNKVSKTDREIDPSWNFSIPKTKEILNFMLNISDNTVIKEYIKSAFKEVEIKNKNPVIFFIIAGDLSTVIPSPVKDSELSSYVTHDLEHAVFTSGIEDAEDHDRDIEEYENHDVRRKMWNYKMPHSIHKDDFYFNTMSIAKEVSHEKSMLKAIAKGEDIKGLKYTKSQSNAIKIENAFKSFFDNIEFAKMVDVGDIMPSVWAYCVSKMKNKNDLDEVTNNDVISVEDKKIICDILENSHDNCMSTLKKFLQKINDRIVFISTWG
jgi:hypothetical protein